MLFKVGACVFLGFLWRLERTKVGLVLRASNHEHVNFEVRVKALVELEILTTNSLVTVTKSKMSC